MKRIICVFFSVFLMVNLMISGAMSAEDSGMDGHKAIVTVKLLNGRLNPSKGAMKTAFFDRGDVLELTGWWSDDHNWVEVYGGDGGACWVARQYVTECEEPFMVVNKDYDKVKIRKTPSDKARVTGHLKRGREILITQVILGWGKCKEGWVDLYYLQEED